MNLLAAFFRSAVTLALFALFGLGGLFVTPIVIVLRDVELCTRLLRFLWYPFVRLFVFTGLITIDCTRLRETRGSVIAANHPSLIDVVVVLALVPKTLFVAKHSLKKNPFTSAMVRNASLPDDERLVDSAKPYLRKGWNVIVFPEGTRSPSKGGLWPFKRGAAQLAIRSGAPLVPLAVIQSPFRILGKHQYAWQMGSKKVKYTLVSGEPVSAVQQEGESMHSASRRVTSQLERVFADGLLAG